MTSTVLKKPVIPAHSPLVVAVIVFLFSAVFSAMLIWRLELYRLQDKRAEASVIARDYAHLLENNIERALSATYPLAALIRRGNGAIPPDFETFANQMLRLYPGISAFALAPGGIVKSMVPLAGNEEAMGHDLLKDPARTKEAFMARDTGKLTLAGPFNLKQGGVGAAGRLPVFLGDERDRSFWGFAVVIIRFPDVLANLPKLDDKGYYHELWRRHPDTGKKQTIDKSSHTTLLNPVEYSLKLPNGLWNLSISPVKGGWGAPLQLSLEVMLGLVFSLLLAYIAGLLVALKAREQEIVQHAAELEKEISERKQAEESLRESESEQRRQREFLECLIANAGTCIAVVKGRELRYTVANPAFQTVAAGEPMIGRTYREVFPEAAAAGAEAGVQRVLETGEPWVIEAYHTQVPGKPDAIWQGHVVRLPLAAGQEPSALVVVWDITEHKHMEDALRQSRDELELRVQERTAQLSQAYEKLQHEMSERERIEEQLRQAQKMEAIGTLAGGIAHDFNNILAAILGFTEMAAEDVADRPEVAKNLRNVLKSITRARDLIRQILTFSRKTSRVRSPLSLSPIIKETVQLLRASIPATIEINLSLSANSDTVLASPVEIQQILMNLATNASLAMQEKGGTMEVALADIDLLSDLPMLDSEVSAGEYVQLVVRDTGTGMSPDVMKRVFEPFFTTREVGKGTGMGLAVVYGIVKDLRGTVTVESELGNGSTFRVLLLKEKTELKEEQPHTSQIPAGKERILFVDDEEMLVEWGETVLERLGYQVTAIADPAEALRVFRADPSLFDLVVTDHAMPHMAGSVLSSELLKARSDIPIILYTGHSETLSREKAQGLGIREFLIKPLNKQELAEAVRKVLDEKKSL
jgi:two-component system, cell cycle sensor histidine kinase and response regulator CckA